MINLFNIPISEIKHNGTEICLIKLNECTIYEKTLEPFYMEYTIDNTSTNPLDYFHDYSGIDSNYGVFYPGLPLIYADSTNYDYNYSKVEIFLLDGTTTDDMTTTCDQIEKIKIWFPRTTYAIKFTDIYIGNSGTICTSINYIDTSNIINMNSMFSSCFSLTGINIVNTNKVTDMSYMFFDCKSLTSLDVSNWDVSNVKNMSNVFSNCESLTSLDVSNWDTSKVTDMDGMFNFCYKLTQLDVSNWNTSKVTNMSCMFYNCYKLTSIDVSNFDTSKVTDMGGAFYNCRNLTTLDVSNWDTSKVTNMDSLFGWCHKVTKLDVSNWDTSNATDMGNMFYNCESLTSLDVSNWDVSNVTNMRSMFAYCDALTSLDLSNWDVLHITTAYDFNHAFNYCTSLVDFYPPKHINADMDVSGSGALSHDSLVRIINNLTGTTSTKRLTLGTTNLAKLSSEEKAIATQKGWTLK